MSLGGLTTIALTAHAPELVRRATLVDVTPGVDRDKAAPIAQFISGPESFESFDEILDRTVQFNPTRSVSSLRRGILHNAVERDDGRWVWRYQRPRLVENTDMEVPADFAALWDDVSAIKVPLMLVRGMANGTVVDDGDEAELLRRQPDRARRARRRCGPQHPGRQAGGARGAPRRLRRGLRRGSVAPRDRLAPITDLGAFHATRATPGTPWPSTCSRRRGTGRPGASACGPRPAGSGRRPTRTPRASRSRSGSRASR